MLYEKLDTGMHYIQHLVMQLCVISSLLVFAIFYVY